MYRKMLDDKIDPAFINEEFVTQPFSTSVYKTYFYDEMRLKLSIILSSSSKSSDLFSYITDVMKSIFQQPNTWKDLLVPELRFTLGITRQDINFLRYDLQFNPNKTISNLLRRASAIAVEIDKFFERWLSIKKVADVKFEKGDYNIVRSTQSLLLGNLMSELNEPDVKIEYILRAFDYLLNAHKYVQYLQYILSKYI